MAAESCKAAAIFNITANLGFATPFMPVPVRVVIRKFLRDEKTTLARVRQFCLSFDPSMKINFFAAFAGVGLAFATAGCVSTVSDTQTSGFHVPDSVQGAYQRPLDQVYGAAVQVINNNGVLLTEYIPHDTTNAVRSLEGKVNQEKVWIRVEAVDPQVTQVTVQARTSMGGDVEEAHELEKEIALQLARQ